MECRWIAWAGLAFATGCVPPGSNTGSPDAAPAAQPIARAAPAVSAPPPPPSDILRAPFEDDFSRTAQRRSPVEGDGSAIGTSDLGPDWVATAPGIWHIEGGKLCGERAHNHGVWLVHALPVNARIEFDARSQSADGDIKAEYWGDGRSFATTLSYSNATSYLTIFGGWHNKFHVLARINEHGNDRKEITVDPRSDDPRERPAIAGQQYHFKIERSDGRTVRWWVDGNEMATYSDTAPLTGPGHDHFGFNDWEVKVCFDSVRIVPLP
jgi:hypothetical protein